MDVLKFIADQWQLVASAPIPFVTWALLFFGAGFAGGKLFYGTVAEVSKARLEAARDDLARLETRRVEDTKDAAFLRVEVASLRAAVELAPKITAGDGPPAAEWGKKGDIYFQLEPVPPVQVAAESRMFLQPPKETVASALGLAATSGKPIFLVIYDPEHPTKSKLAYSLGYFLEYQTTRKLVDEHFVSALVPSTDMGAKAFVPADDPLENARWVVLSKHGQVLRTEGLYANADEGLKRVREAIALAEARSSEA